MSDAPPVELRPYGAALASLREHLTDAAEIGDADRVLQIAAAIERVQEIAER
jgi:hypothetical protein